MFAAEEERAAAAIVPLNDRAALPHGPDDPEGVGGGVKPAAPHAGTEPHPRALPHAGADDQNGPPAARVSPFHDPTIGSAGLGG